MYLFGCEHCGFVRGIRGDHTDGGSCPDCGKVLSEIAPERARELIHQRYLARQFRRATQSKSPVERPPPAEPETSE
jgi:hypothetical protein